MRLVGDRTSNRDGPRRVHFQHTPVDGFVKGTFKIGYGPATALGLTTEVGEDEWKNGTTSFLTYSSPGPKCGTYERTEPSVDGIVPESQVPVTSLGGEG